MNEKSVKQEDQVNKYKGLCTNNRYCYNLQARNKVNQHVKKEKVGKQKKNYKAAVVECMLRFQKVSNL